jgi:hypothetical protein
LGEVGNESGLEFGVTTMAANLMIMVMEKFNVIAATRTDDHYFMFVRVFALDEPGHCRGV